MGLLDFLGLGAPALSPQEQQYVSFLGGNPGATMAAMDPRALRSQAAWGALGEVGARIADAYAPRPITQPRPSLGAAIGSFGPAYSRGLMTGAQAQQLEQQAQRQQAYQGLLNQMPESQRALFATLPPEQGALAMAQSQLRQGRLASPEEHQQAGLPFGTLYFDQNGRPHTLNTPGLAGMTTDAQERARAPYHPIPLVPGGTLIQNPGVAQGALPQLAMAESGGNPSAINPDTGAAGTYQFLPDTWAGVLQRNPQLAQRWSPRDITNPQAQQEVAQVYRNEILTRNRDLIGRQVNGVPVTEDALVRGGWLGGPDGVRRYIETGGMYNPADANGTRIGDYFNGTARNMRSTVAGAPGGPRVLAQSPVAAPGTPEGSQDRLIGETLGTQFRDIEAASTAARQTLAQLDRVQAMFRGIQQGGPLAQSMLRIRAIAQQLGIPLGEDVSQEQAAQALANEFALQLRNPQGGAGMPGAMSDADREFLLGMSPGLAQTPQGRELIIDARRRTAQRDQEVASFTRRYMRDHGGRLDLNFQDALAENFSSRPLFGTDFQRRMGEILGTAQPGTTAPAGTQAPAQGAPPQTMQPAPEGQQRSNGTPLPRTPNGQPDRMRLRDGEIYISPNGMRGRWNASRGTFTPVE